MARSTCFSFVPHARLSIAWRGKTTCRDWVSWTSDRGRQSPVRRSKSWPVSFAHARRSTMGLAPVRRRTGAGAGVPPDTKIRRRGGPKIDGRTGSMAAAPCHRTDDFGFVGGRSTRGHCPRVSPFNELFQPCLPPVDGAATLQMAAGSAGGDSQGNDAERQSLSPGNRHGLRLHRPEPSDARLYRLRRHQPRRLAQAVAGGDLRNLAAGTDQVPAQ